MNLKLGFSTGCLHKTGLSIAQSLRAISGAGCRAVELGFVKLIDFQSEKFEAIQSHDLDPFDYVSLHAPVFAYGKNEVTKAIFGAIERFNRVRKLDLVIFHPDAIVHPEVFDDASFAVAFENMDNRKKSCRVPRDLKLFLGRSQRFSLVLDVNHIYSNDPSMGLAADFYEAFGRRISQLHLSGYAGYHEPLFETRQRQIIDAIQDFSVPVIVEGILTPEGIARERDYIFQTVEELRG